MNNFYFQREETLAQKNKKICRDLLLKSPLSMGMIVILYIMFFVCCFTDISKGQFSLAQFNIYTLIKYGANYSKLVIEQKEYYRLITAMFLHGGIAHILMNSLSFMAFLSPIEMKVRNHYLFFCTLFFGGILGNMLTDCVSYHIKNEILVGVGASTSICAVIGLDFAYKIYKVDNQQTSNKYFYIVIGYLAILSIFIPNVDTFGHFGSLFGGLFIGLAFFNPGQTFGNREKAKSFRLFGKFLLLVYAGVLTLGILITK